MYNYESEIFMDGLSYYSSVNFKPFGKLRNARI